MNISPYSLIGEDTIWNILFSKDYDNNIIIIPVGVSLITLLKTEDILEATVVSAEVLQTNENSRETGMCWTTAPCAGILNKFYEYLWDGQPPQGVVIIMISSIFWEYGSFLNTYVRQL